MRTALKARVDALVTALERDLPDARFVAPEGGYFMWVELPEGTDVDKLFAAAGERGVTFVKGSDFLLEGGRNTLRLAYSGVTPEQIDEGIGRLAEAYNSLSGTPARGLTQGSEEVGDDVVGLLLDLAFAVASCHVAVAAQPEVAVVVCVGLVGALVLAAVELDGDAPLAPQAVDRPRPDGLVALRSSMLWPMSRSRKRRSRRLFISPWPGACSFSAARRLALPGCPRRKVRSTSCGAQVVLELGFGERSSSARWLVAGGEVQERARDRGGREAAVSRGVARAQVAADEDRQPLGPRAVSRHRELDHRGRGRNDAPAPGRRPVTEQGPVARGQQGGDEVPLLGEQFGRHRRVHAAMDAVQPAGADGAIDR